MFEIKSRTASITTNDEERQSINEQLQAIQDKEGFSFSSIKDAFLHLLRAYNQQPAKEHLEGHVAISEDEAANLHAVNDMYGQIKEALSTNLPSTEIQDKTTLDVVLNVIESNKNAAQKLAEKPVTVERELQAHEILLQFNDETYPKEKKIELLKGILARRKNNPNKIERHRIRQSENTVAEMIENMIFNPNIVYNMGGEFYTGIKKIK